MIDVQRTRKIKRGVMAARCTTATHPLESSLIRASYSHCLDDTQNRAANARISIEPSDVVEWNISPSIYLPTNVVLPEKQVYHMCRQPIYISTCTAFDYFDCDDDGHPERCNFSIAVRGFIDGKEIPGDPIKGALEPRGKAWMDYGNNIVSWGELGSKACSQWHRHFRRRLDQCVRLCLEHQADKNRDDYQRSLEALKGFSFGDGGGDVEMGRERFMPLVQRPDVQDPLKARPND